MIDLSPFLTPYPRPNLAPVGSGADAVSELADFREKQAQFRQKQAVDEGQLANQQAQTGINRTQAEATAAHFAAEAKNQAAIRTAEADAKKQAQLSNLETAFRKAKTPEQRQLIRQAYERLGYKTQEVDTDLPDPNMTAAAAQASSQSAVGAEASTKNFYGGNNEPIDVGAPYALQKGMADQVKKDAATSPSSSDEPFPWEMVGMGAPKPAAPAAPTAPKRGGKYVVTGPDGVPVLTYDEPLEGKQRADSIRSAFAGLQSGSPEEKAAADKAVSVASGYAQQTSDMDGAKQLAMDVYKASIGEYRKKYPGGGGGGGPAVGPTGLTKGEAKAETQATGVALEIQKTYDKPDVAEQRRSRAIMSGAVEMLNNSGDSGMVQFGALKEYLAAISGKTVTDKELDGVMSSGGKFAKWQYAMDAYTQEGRMPPEVQAGLQSLLQHKIKSSQTELDRVAKDAYQQVLGMTGDERAAANVRGHFNGDFTVGTGETSLKTAEKRVGGGSGSQSSAAKRKALEDLVK